MFEAAAAGFRLGLTHFWLLLGLWLINLLFAVPAAAVLGHALQDSLGESRLADNLRSGFDMGWYGEFKADAKGIETTFAPTLTGAGGAFRNLEGWATGDLFRSFPGVVALGLGYALLWALLVGGVVRRYVETDQAWGPSRFLEAGARFFFRFARLAILSAPLYLAIYWLYRKCLTRLETVTRDVTAERTVLLYCMAVVLVVGFLLVLVHVCFAYAKIATVLEDRRSMLLAALRGVGFVLQHPGRTLGLYLLVALVSGLVLALYAWIAPGATQSSWATVILAFLLGQAYLLVRLLMQLSLLGGQLALYRDFAGRNPSAERVQPALQPESA